jgi:hypothetical protein
VAPHTGDAGAPSALTHGLASRWAMEALAEEAAALALRLIGASPPTEPIMRAARRAAEAILRLNRVRSVKTYAMNQAEFVDREKVYEFEGLAQFFTADFYKIIAAELSRDFNRMSRGQEGAASAVPDPVAGAMLKFLAANEDLWRRLDDYERRALSQRTKAIRELDLARIEAERGGE